MALARLHPERISLFLFSRNVHTRVPDINIGRARRLLAVRFGKASTATANNVWSFDRAVGAGHRRVHLDRLLADGADGGEQRRGRVGDAGGRGVGEAVLLGRDELQGLPAGPGHRADARVEGVRLYLAFQIAGQRSRTSSTLWGPPVACRVPTGHDGRHHHISLSGGSGGGSPATGGGGDGDGDGDDDGGENGEGKGKKSKRSGEGNSDGGDGKRETKHASASSSGTSVGGGLSAKRRHGVLALLSWGATIPIGVALARFLKRLDPLWFCAHVAAQGLGSALGVAAIVAGFKLDDDDEGPVAHSRRRRRAGLRLMALLARPAKETKARRYWNWYHHNVGRAAVVNVFYGLKLASERQEWSYVYGIIVGVFAVACLGEEEWRRRQ
ncbi:hypothetical protein EJB05_18123, partial [Eragrostis curvula]